ncbi:hypothetical protein PMI42_06905 [Bradyrhizobium sp. YR681]|uniref:hypothetical protein n=1 Tax=Bradyrhizobium sp. YR681 TaxID=1144344 RepID=UPI00026F97E4|nr:hypothetical protein [Bradyrhizobium sp. YR681]EJN09148.1 hypothetical protein PMI42_06905 [Bradyrhizobium sp. YR681]
MMLVVILVSILAGFGAGYATRAWGQRERVERNPLHRPYSTIAFRQNNSLMRVRRAF